MNLQKSDVLVSVGIILDSSVKVESIKNLHEHLNKTYNYFEILLLKQPESNLDSSLNSSSINNNFTPPPPRFYSLLESLDNLRIIEISNKPDYGVLNAILIENAIGDYVALFSPQAQSINDLMSMLEFAPFYDCVIGKRNKKIQGFLNTIFSKLFYKLVALLTHIKIDSSYDDFLVINRKVVNFLINQNEKIKFIRLIALNSNFDVKEFSYTPIGKSKTRSFLANVNFAIDLIISNSFKLLRIASISAFSMALFNLLYICYIFLIYIFKDFVIAGWASSNLYNSIIYGVLFLILGIVCEYIRIVLINQKQNKDYEIIDEKTSTALLFNKNIEEM